MLIPSWAAGRGSERRRQPKYGRLCMKNDEKGKGVGTGWGGWQRRMQVPAFVGERVRIREQYAAMAAPCSAAPLT